MRLVTAIALVSLFLATYSVAQSLGDVAKKEKDRRKGIETAASVIDEETLSGTVFATPVTESSVTTGSEDSDSDTLTSQTADREARPESTDDSKIRYETIVAADDCRTALRGLQAEQRKGEDILTRGVPDRVVRARHGTVRGDGKTATFEPAEGKNIFSKATVYKTCDEAALNPRRERAFLAQCEELRKRLPVLRQEITAKTAECAKLDRAAFDLGS